MLQSLRSALILLSSLQIYGSLLHEQDSPKYLQYPAAANIKIFLIYIIPTKWGSLKQGVGCLIVHIRQYIKGRKSNFFFD